LVVYAIYIIFVPDLETGNPKFVNFGFSRARESGARPELFLQL
jgi:hypothetical protein